MVNKYLHIVSLDVPYPVDYGGVFDLFYKLKALHEAGVNIVLHCFEYGRGQQPILEKYCAEVHYYPRKQGLAGFNGRLPYMVASRQHPRLLHRLLKDDYPVLMEGMHCTYYLHTGQLPRARCFVRLHNVEYQYYKHLANTTTSPFKKLYYQTESKLLHNYEKGLANKADFWAVTQKDAMVYQEEFGYQSIDFLPLYLPEYTPQWNGERGSYCLYHGNLSVAENEKAGMWLLENVFDTVELPLVIAGKQPSKALEKMAHRQNHTCLVANPSEADMLELIRKAQVNILPAFNDTGIKLKLINALYHGRHCLANNAGVDGSGLNHCCTIANSTAAMRRAVSDLFDRPFTYYDFEERSQRLKHLFNNANNAQQMVRWIFGGAPTRPGGSTVGVV
jgi:glycosyltransferase involved in cell wall biosynthesis